jgi:hypothetical protein
VVFLKYSGEFRIDTFTKNQNVLTVLLTSVDNYATNFTTQSTINPYERVLEGWTSILARMNVRPPLKSFVSILQNSSYYLSMGSNTSIASII